MIEAAIREVPGATMAAELLADAVSQRRAADAAEARLLERAAGWADLHPPESICDAAVFDPPPGAEQGERIAGIGCPLVAEFCIAELAAALGTSTAAGKRLVGHALELRHRLPRLWAAVHAGSVPAWRARRVAEATIHADLTAAGAGFVDRMVTPCAATVGLSQLDRVVAEALARYGSHAPAPADPDGPDGASHDPRFVDLDPPRDAYGRGTASLLGALDPADALDLDHALATGAERLKALGCEASLGVRRSMALGQLARHQTTLDLTAQAGADPTRASSPSARQVVLHVHLCAAVTGEGRLEFDRLARLEHHQLQVLLAQVQDWVATSHTSVTIRPVLDLAAQVRSLGYTPAAHLRELVIERDGTCVFPWCSRPARRCQLDHIRPYDPHDTAAGTHAGNLACLCTFHHRLKTHGGWRYTTTAPGEYTWTSPHGLTYHRDHAGTHPHHREPPRP